MNTHLNERVSEIIAKTREMLFKREVERRDEKAALIRDRLGVYKQYLLTLDLDILSNIILDLSDDGSVFVTYPVEIRDIYDMKLTCRGYDMFFGKPGSNTGPNAYPLFAIPTGKYRFVLIAVPVEDDV